MKVFSFGGGVQSTAALVLAAQGRIDYRVFLFANVGDDSENPDTLEYVRQFSRPYAEAHGLELHELRRETNSGETLYQRTMREERSIGIPMRFPSGVFGRRPCTIEFKIHVIERWLGKGTHSVGLGISLDEFQRMRVDPRENFTNDYPLIDLRLTRKDCKAIIRQAGLPTPPKSSCWFCPFHSYQEWRDLRRKRPDLFAKAVELEKAVSDRSIAIGRSPLYLTQKGLPIDQVIGDQPALFEVEDTCESGYCMT